MNVRTSECEKARVCFGRFSESGYIWKSVYERTCVFVVQSVYWSIPNAFLLLSFLNSDGSGNKQVRTLSAFCPVHEPFNFNTRHLCRHLNLSIFQPVYYYYFFFIFQHCFCFTMFILTFNYFFSDMHLSSHFFPRMILTTPELVNGMCMMSQLVAALTSWLIKPIIIMYT